MPKSTLEIVIPGPEAPMPAAEAAARTLQLAGVNITGNTVLSASDLAPLYQSLVGHDVSVAQLFALRDAITAKYRSAGYVLSQAILPPQTTTGGIVHIQIVEGYISAITINGAFHDRRGLINRMADKIKRSRPLRMSDLERYVFLISDLPGVVVKTTLAPSTTEPGTADLIVTVSHKGVGGFAALDNRGSQSIGPEELQAGIDLNSVLGQDEHTSLLYATSGQPRELQYGAIASDWILNAEGARLSLNAGYSHTEPSGAIHVLDPLGTGWTGRAVLDFPVIRTRARTLHLGAAFGFRDTRTDLLNIRFSEDRVRYVAANASLDFADTAFGDAMRAQTLITGELSHGLDGLGATKTGSPNLSRVNGHSDYTKFYAEATRIQWITKHVSLAIAVAGQLSATPLLSAEQFGLGGSRFGRGFEPSELTGDEGLAGSVEAHYNFTADWRGVNSPYAYAFYDAGAIRNIDPPAGSARSESLASTGVGIQFSFMDHFAADFEVAKPATRDVASRANRNLRPLFNISTRY